MKIIDARITDPRRGGEYRNPYLTVEVDEELHETGDEIYEDMKAITYRWTPYGPFVAVDERGNIYDTDTWENADIGRFNTTNLYRHRLVEVEVLTPTEQIDLAMGLDRARRLLRKHQLDWRYVLDDVAGQHGKVLWRLVEHVPTCVMCGRRAVTENYYRRTHMSLCETHSADLNKMIRQLRVTNS